MRKITFVTLALAGSAALVGATTLPAFAETVDDGTTDITVTVTAGALTIGVPLAIGGTEIVPGTSADIEIGETTVSDLRAGEAAWNVDVALGAFLDAATTETFIDTAAVYAPTNDTVDSANSTVTPGTSTTLGVAASTVQSAVVSGNNTAAWTADLTVNMPASALAGTYVATLTHSVIN